MTAKLRKTQHKPKREIKEIRQSEVKDFRSENQRLRRENSRLRREVDKYVAAWEGTAEDEPPLATEPRTTEPTKATCIGCGGASIARVRIGAKTIVACKDCKHRHIETDPPL